MGGGGAKLDTGFRKRAWSQHNFFYLDCFALPKTFTSYSRDKASKVHQSPLVTTLLFQTLLGPYFAPSKLSNSTTFALSKLSNFHMLDPAGFSELAALPYGEVGRDAERMVGDIWGAP